MKVFHVFTGIIVAFLLQIFPSLGYKGVINTQISIYNKLKQRAPNMSENERLNYLITSRIESLPRVASKEEEYAYYTPLIENPNKTLEGVIYAIVEYEYILSREEHIINKLTKMGFTQPQILAERDNQREKYRAYIKERIDIMT